jgi:hypothetical protein
MQTQTKRVLGILLALLLGMSLLAGCGKAPTDNPGGTPGTADAAEETAPGLVHHAVEPAIGAYITYSPEKFKPGTSAYLLKGIDGRSGISFLNSWMPIDVEKEVARFKDSFDVDSDTEVTIAGFTARKLTYERSIYGHCAQYFILYDEPLVSKDDPDTSFVGMQIDLWAYDDILESADFMDVLNSYTIEA